MIRKLLVLAAVVGVLLQSGCAPFGVPLNESGGAAAIVGRVAQSSGTAKALASAQGACPEVRITINGSPTSLEFGDDCSFVIDGVQPSGLVEIRVELVALGVAGTVELSNVEAGELIEIVVEPTDDSLSVSVERRVTPDPADVLPVVVEGNNVSILLPAGTYDQGLTVRGNNFTLVGEAGESCADATGWSVITGAVEVDGNNATFRNIRFEGSVTLRGNNARLINCCFGGELVVFGNTTEIGDDDDDDDDDEDDDEDDDD